jgi:hypothetical protein
MFEVEAAMKDMSLAEDIWYDLGHAFPTLSSALSDCRSAAAHGLSRADLIAVREWLNR